MVRREGFEPPAFWSVGCLKHKSESFRLRFVLFTTVRSADFPLFPFRPARFFPILGQKLVRGGVCVKRRSPCCQSRLCRYPSRVADSVSKAGRREGRYTVGHASQTDQAIIKNVLGKMQKEVKEKLKKAIEENTRLQLHF